MTRDIDRFSAHQLTDLGGCVGLRASHENAAASFLAMQLAGRAAAMDALSGHGGPADPLKTYTGRFFTRSESPAGRTALQGPPPRTPVGGHSGRPLLR